MLSFFCKVIRILFLVRMSNLCFCSASVMAATVSSNSTSMVFNKR